MRLIAVTGHVNVSEEIADWLCSTLSRRLPELIGSGRLRGITCLAKGPDQLFASVILTLSGSFEVILPARDYQRRMIEAGDGETFQSLLAQASTVRTMPFEVSSRAAYLAASEAMLIKCDLLLAVWDGQASQRIGDTADVVRRARELSVPVEVLWPSDSVRRRLPASVPVQTG